MEQLRFSSEVRKPDDLKLPDAELAQNHEINMALELIDHLTKPFNPEQFKDTYTDELKTMIEDKAKGKTPKPKGQAPVPTKVPDLMEVLRASLERAQTSSPH